MNSIESGSREVFDISDRNTESNELIDQAREAALANLPDRRPVTAESRVLNAINNCFKPYEKENQIIASQITSETYERHLKRLGEFIPTLCGAVVCPDGRILSVSVGDPRFLKIQRNLAGMPDISFSFRGASGFEVNDAGITSTVKSQMERRINEGKSLELVQFYGPHIDSAEALNGCGAQRGNTTSTGRAAVNAMRYGGIEEYFSNLGDGISAFSKLAKDAGGKSTTLSMVHDAHSQGLIFGLDEVYKAGKKQDADMFDHGLSLRDNLLMLHNQGQVIMTEILDRELSSKIFEIQSRKNYPPQLDIRNPQKLANNMMSISDISIELTDFYEKEGYPFIPEAMKSDKTEEALKAWAYHMIRNSVYRKMSGITPGRHDLIHHPERLIRVGPIGTAHNVGIIPFIQHAPPGRLRPSDIQGVQRLYALSEDILPKHGVDLSNEARIIITTARYESTHYASNSQHAAEALNSLESEVRINVGLLSEAFKDGVIAGETVILGVIKDSESRRIVRVVK